MFISIVCAIAAAHALRSSVMRWTEEVFMREWSTITTKLPIADDAASRVSPKQHRKRPGLAAAVLIAIAGLGAGWIAGKTLSRAVSATPPPVDVPNQENLNSFSSPPVRSQSGGSQLQPEHQPGVVKSDPDRRQSMEDELEDIPDSEEPSKEIGRQALKKLMKEIEKTNRGKRHGKQKHENHQPL